MFKKLYSGSVSDFTRLKHIQVCYWSGWQKKEKKKKEKSVVKKTTTTIFLVKLNKDGFFNLVSILKLLPVLLKLTDYSYQL